MIGSSVVVMASADTGLQANGELFSVISFNLHGLNNSRSYLTDLCNNPDVFIIAVQEHWLTPSTLHVFNDIHPDFMGFGISAMNSKLTSGVFKGRPFGGVAFLWRKSISKYRHYI